MYSQPKGLLQKLRCLRHEEVLKAIINILEGKLKKKFSLKMPGLTDYYKKILL